MSSGADHADLLHDDVRGAVRKAMANAGLPYDDATRSNTQSAS
jgi:hypothetical protein